jgi:DNA-binding response OmpR family regulator
MIVLFTKDLMIQSSVSAAAKPLGLVLRSFSNTSSAASAVLSGESVDIVVVDLQTPGLSLHEVRRFVAESGQRPAVIAFAQHVENELLDSASILDDAIVLTRGQFSRQLPAILQQLR